MKQKTAAIFTSIFLIFFVLCANALTMEKEKSLEPKGSIKGQVKVTQEGDLKTLTGIVAFFDIKEGMPSGIGTFHRAPNGIAKLDEQGNFNYALGSGNYYIGIVLGRSSGTVGPPRPGEQSFTVHDNEGKPRIFEVRNGTVTDAGLVSGKTPSAGNLADIPTFSVQGVIRDEAGKPFEGAKVIAFLVGDPKRRPAFTYTGTGKDGTYLLKLPADNAYNISVRAKYGGGQPAAGEYIGRYGDKEILAVTAKKDEILKGVDVNLIKVPERLPQGNAASPLRKRQPGLVNEKEKSPEQQDK